MIKVLIILPNNAEIKGFKNPAGFWFSEYVHFYTVVKMQNYDIDIASVLGGNIEPDKLSTQRFFIDKEAEAYFYSREFMENKLETFSLNEIKTKKYDAVYLAGGIGSFVYFNENNELTEIIKATFANGGYVSACGFGVIALLGLSTNGCDYLIDRKQITGFSKFEEQLIGINKIVPFKLQDEIVKRNAFYSKAAIPLTSYAIKDGRIITGENASSTRAVAWQLVYSLK